jgi:pimeloyl-ACP methyl ester carboxylesterase
MSPEFLKKKSIKTPAGQIYYFYDRSFPNRPTVVLLHGLSSNHTTWLATISELHEKKINSLAIELRGHGLSDKTRQRSLYRLPIFVADLRQVIQAENLHKPFLVGYSFGGPVALGYAAEHPEAVAGLVVISANYLNPLTHMHLKLLTPVLYAGVNALGYLLIWQQRRRYLYYQHAKARGYLHSTWVGLNTMPLSVNLWMLSELTRVNLSRSLHRVQAPTLIVRAAGDPFFSQAEAEDMLKLMPQAQLINSKHPNHFIASRAQQELSDVILRFITQHENSHL